MSSAARKPAPRLARPAARYWKGKAPKGAGEVPSDSDGEEELQQPEEEGDIQIGDQDYGEEEDEDEPPTRAAAKPAVTKSINVALKDVNISRDGRVVVAGREESGRTELEGALACVLVVLADRVTRVVRGLGSGSYVSRVELGSEESSEEEEEEDGKAEVEDEEVALLGC